jgi:hypothetical protein
MLDQVDRVVEARGPKVSAEPFVSPSLSWRSDPLYVHQVADTVRLL